MTPLLKMVILKICPFIFIVGFNKLGLLLIILFLEHPKAQSLPHYLVSVYTHSLSDLIHSHSLKFPLFAGDS